jgi:hypothetical protein
MSENSKSSIPAWAINEYLLCRAITVQVVVANEPRDGPPPVMTTTTAAADAAAIQPRALAGTEQVVVAVSDGPTTKTPVAALGPIEIQPSPLMSTCNICLATIDSPSGWNCPIDGTSTCPDCLSQYITTRLQDQISFMPCPGYECAHELTSEEIRVCTSGELSKAVVNFKRLQADKNLRQCSRCAALVAKDEHSLEMKCLQCDLVFCYHHGT